MGKAGHEITAQYIGFVKEKQGKVPLLMRDAGKNYCTQHVFDCVNSSRVHISTLDTDVMYQHTCRLLCSMSRKELSSPATLLSFTNDGNVHK